MKVKTDWQASDIVKPDDMNRIERNIETSAQAIEEIEANVDDKLTALSEEVDLKADTSALTTETATRESAITSLQGDIAGVEIG